MQFTLIPVTPFAQNCSLLICERTQKAAIVDPGGDLETIKRVIAQKQVDVEKIFLTHAHLDHCAGAGLLAKELNIPIEGPHPEDQFWLDALPIQVVQFDFPPTEAFKPTRWLHDGDTVAFGEQSLQVLHCPGHTPGHVVFFHENSRLAIVGDVLFKGSIGRTDFPRSNHQALINAIGNKLFPLGDDIEFIPGHGPMSTFGHERLNNPYVGEQAIKRQKF